MTDLRTISPDELPELSEIPEDLRTVVFSPNGPLQAVPHKRLLSKLIATNLCKATKAALDADLAHAADSVALVFADPTAALNGWYRKTGASGAGAWQQFEELARNSRILAAASATQAEAARLRAGNAVPWLLRADLIATTGAENGDRAIVTADAATHVAVSGEVALGGAAAAVGAAIPNEGRYTRTGGAWLRTGDTDAQRSAAQVGLATSAATAASAAAKIAGGLGVGPDTLTTTTVGSTTPNALTWPNAGQYVANAEGAPYTGTLDNVGVRLSATGPVIIHILKPDRQTVVRSFVDAASVVGVNTFASFGGYVIQKDELVAVLPANGHVRYVAGGLALSYPSSEYSGSLGDTVPLTTSANTMAISFTVSGLAETFDDRLRATEQFAVRSALSLTAEPQETAFSQTIGTTDPDSFTMPAGSAYGLCIETRSRCILDSVPVRVDGVSLIQIDIVNRDTSVPVATFSARAPSAGVHALPIPGEYVLEPNHGVFVRVIAGGRLRALTGTANGRSLVYANSNYTGVGNAVTISSNTILLAMAINIRTLPRPSADRTNVFRQLFHGTSAPADWTIPSGGPFSVSNGLVANGTGSWAPPAFWNNFSACHRKTISARIEVADVASVFAITSNSQTAVTTGAVQVDGTANTLSIMRRASGGASVTAARSVTIPALVSGRVYILEAVQRENGVIGRLTDTITGTTTTVTCEWLEVNPGSSSDRIALQGRPAFVHLSGNVRVDWFDLTNDLPKRLRWAAFGDSNLEAAVVSSNVPVGASWGHRLAQRIPGMISAVPQGTTEHAVARCAADLDPHIFDIVLHANGTNDTSQAVYRTQTAAFISRVAANGEVIILTQPPRVTGTAIQQACNADVRARFFGAYRFIDVARRMSSGNDGSTVDTGKIFDTVHYNRVGQRDVADLVTVSLPQLARAVP